MPSFKAEPFHVAQLTHLLHEPGAGHLRVRKHGALLIIESGPDEDPWSHARLRRDGVHLWCLEIAISGRRWEGTPFRSTMPELVDLLLEQFGWWLAPVVWEPAL